MSFKKAVEKVLNHEGGYVHDPDDPGGETKYGISKKSYPEIDIKSLSREQAIEIYKRDFWDDVCKYIDEIDERIALCYFDTAANIGKRNASLILQKSINFFLQSYKRNKIAEDGIIGPITMGELEWCLEGIGDFFAVIFTLERVKHYIDLCKRWRGGRKYLLGWIDRALDCLQL